MGKRISNVNGLSLSMAVWLAAEPYNHDENIPVDGIDFDPVNEEMISVTTLMKPTRQFVLSQRVPPLALNELPDVTDVVGARLGHAIHQSQEDAWKLHYAHAMRRLGYPESLIRKVRINPPDEPKEEGILPVYLEQRYFKRFDGVCITGQFDKIINGQLEDTKSTSVFTYIGRKKEEDYRIQMSIYRWINPDKITTDIAHVQHVFTDWSAPMSNYIPGYPPHRLHQFTVELMSLKDTEAWIRRKLAEIRANVDLAQSSMVRCSDKDLWREPPQYRYYADPSKANASNKSSKNFINKQDALIHQSTKGKGTVITVPGRVKACSYCPAFTICTQKDAYEHG